jgi:plastocyanin
MSVRLSLIVASLLFGVACHSSSMATTPTQPTPTPASTTNASIVSGARTLGSNAYSPNPINVPVGTTVVWTNNDSISHNTTASGGLWASGTMAPGAQYSFKFTTAGTFQYVCTFHPGMVGTVNVQ